MFQQWQIISEPCKRVYLYGRLESLHNLCSYVGNRKEYNHNAWNEYEIRMEQFRVHRVTSHKRVTSKSSPRKPQSRKC